MTPASTTTPATERRSTALAAPVALFLAASAAGCGWLEARNARSVVERNFGGTVAHNLGFARALCNALPPATRGVVFMPGPHLSQIEVSDVSLAPSGGNYTGVATLRLRATPGAAVQSPTPRCEGTVTFNYQIGGRRTGRRSTTFTWEFTNVVVRDRGGVTVNAQTDLNITPVARPPVAQQLAPGQTVQGTFEPGDGAMSDGSAVDEYTVALTAGQPVTFVARGGAAAPGGPEPRLTGFTMLAWAGTLINYDGGDPATGVSRMVYVPPATGMYTLRVSTLGEGFRGGAYSVSVLPGAQPTAQ